MSARATEHQTQVASETHAGAMFFCSQIEALDARAREQRLRILVAGSGEGHEAVRIQERLHADVTAIDPNVTPASGVVTEHGIRFLRASVEALPFRPGSFDAVFYHHVIEHVLEPALSLTEIARVLNPAGWLFVGTPNRGRLMSAVGAHDHTNWDSTMRNKLRENLMDWRARLRGRFRNEYGAHAGFTASELDQMLTARFQVRRWLTKDYLLFKYRDRLVYPAVRLAVSRWLIGLAAPSIYVWCAKPTSGTSVP